MLYSVCAVLGVCCAWCILYLVYALLGVCYTQCQLMIMTKSDGKEWLNFVFCEDSGVVDNKGWDVGWRWERFGEYQQIWEIRCMTCLIGLRRPHIGVITCLIGIQTCRIRDGKLHRTRNSRKSQFLMMISSISALLSLSRPQLYHYLKTRS